MNDAKAETPVLWPPHAKSWLIGKDSDAGRDWGQEEKGTTEDEMAGWHHGLDGRESKWMPGVGDGQGGLACCNSCGRKESDTTKWLKWTEYAFMIKKNVLTNEYRRNTFQHNKSAFGKLTANTIHSRKNWKPFPLRSERSQGCPLSPLLFNSVQKF